jgi:tetratricopeptide (TPR) repeat protein
MIRNENNIGRALDTVAEDSGRYYVLAYQPANGNFDGKYREIQVRVKRDGVRVRARRGYVALPTSRMLLPTTIAPAGSADRTDAPGEANKPSPAAPAPASVAAPPGTPPGGGVAESTVPSDPIAPPPLPHAPTGTATGSPTAVRLRPDEASRVDALSKRDPGSVNDAAKRGWEAYQRGDVETASETLAVAATGSAARPWVHYALGMSQAALGKVDEAIASWERVRAAVPDFEPVYMDLADTYAAKSDLTSALAIVREAEKRWPDSADVQSAIGVIYVRRGAIDDGIKALEKAAALTPDDGLAWLNLGRAYALRYHRNRRYVTSQRRWTAPEGDRQKAIEALKKCVALGGPYANAANAEMSVLEWSKG